MGGNVSESQPRIRLTSKPSESARPRLWHKPRLTLCGMICYALIGCAASVGITISGGTLDAAGVRSRVTRIPDTSRVPTMDVRSFPPLFECRGRKRFHRTFRGLAMHKGKQELTATSPSLHVNPEVPPPLAAKVLQQNKHKDPTRLPGDNQGNVTPTRFAVLPGRLSWRRIVGVMKWATHKMGVEEYRTQRILTKAELIPLWDPGFLTLVTRTLMKSIKRRMRLERDRAKYS